MILILTPSVIPTMAFCKEEILAIVEAMLQQKFMLFNSSPSLYKYIMYLYIYVDFYRNTKICHQQGYIPEMSKDDVPEELKGKEREIFGNMKQILEWHKR